MSAPADGRGDLGWRRGNLGVLIVLCFLAGAVVACRAASRRVWFDSDVPVNGPRAEQAAEKIDPNTAGVASLVRLRNIGPVRARAIVAYRGGQDGRAFTSADDLAKVKSIGPGTVRRIAPYLALPRRSSGTTSRSGPSGS